MNWIFYYLFLTPIFLQVFGQFSFQRNYSPYGKKVGFFANDLFSIILYEKKKCKEIDVFTGREVG